MSMTERHVSAHPLSSGFTSPRVWYATYPPTSYQAPIQGREPQRSVVRLHCSPVQELGQRDSGRPQEGT